MRTKTLTACLAAAVLVALAAAVPAAARTGSPWQLKNPVGPQQGLRADLKAVCALDGGTAWAAGAVGAVYYTHDGGQSWEALPTGAPAGTEWEAVRFADLRHGMLLGEAADRMLVYRTGDAGRTWAPVPLPEQADLADLELYGSQHVWAVGEHGAVVRSTDGGATWSSADAGTSDLAAVDFTSAALGVAVGENGAVLRTADGGATWARAKVPRRADLSDVTMRTASRGWAVGEKGTVLRTSDGGRTWKRQKTPSGSGDCVAVDFASVKRGWVVTATGRLLGTSDGGRTWKLERHGMGAVRLRDIDVPTHFADAAAADAGPRSAGRRAGRADAATADPDAAAPDRAFAAGDAGALGKYTEAGSSPPAQVAWVVPTGSGPPAISTLAFDLSDYSITQDVNWDGFSANPISGQGLQLIVNADRLGSSAPAQWFTTTCDGIELASANSIGDTPNDLNFAFVGSFSYGAGGGTSAGSVPVAFGQGHDGQGQNNWWVGSAQFHFVWNGSDRLHELGYDFFLIFAEDGDNNFNFEFD